MTLMMLVMMMSKVFGQQIDVWRIRTSSEQDHYRVTCPPQLLQRANADCISSAGSKAWHVLGKEGMADLCLKVSWVFVSSFPDEASANKRHQAYLDASWDEIPNVLFSKGPCFQHILHRIVSKGSHEPELIGHVHAVFVTLGNPRQKDRVRAGMQSFYEEHLEVEPGELDQHIASFQERIARHTALRDELYVGGHGSPSP